MKSPVFRLAARLLPILFYILLIIFLVLYIRSIDFNKLVSLEIVWPFIFIAFLFDMTSRYWMVFIWMSILRGLGAKKINDKRGLAHVYAKSWMGRYIPGTAPWILGKIYFASKHGVEKGKLAVSSLLEAALQIIVLLAFSLFSLVLDPRLNIITFETKVAMGALLAACLTFLLPPVFNQCMNLAHKIIKRKPLSREHFASTNTISQGGLLYLVGAIISGLVFFFVAKSVDPNIGFADLLFIMAVGNLSGALGMLAVFVPSGLGVRESVQLLLLGAITTPEHAIIIAVLARLLSVVSDLAFFVVTRLFTSNKSS